LWGQRFSNEAPRLVPVFIVIHINGSIFISFDEKHYCFPQYELSAMTIARFQVVYAKSISRFSKRCWGHSSAILRKGGQHVGAFFAKYLIGTPTFIIDYLYMRFVPPKTKKRQHCCRLCLTLWFNEASMREHITHFCQTLTLFGKWQSGYKIKTIPLSGFRMLYSS